MADNENSPWEEILRGILGPAADEVLGEMRALGLDPDQMGSSMLPLDPTQVPAMMAQMQSLLSSSNGPVNWKIAREVTDYKLRGEPSVSHESAEELRQALQVADLWLDPVTNLSPARGSREGWTRTDWVKHTLDTWRSLVEPVAQNASRALSDAMGEQLGHFESEAASPLAGIAQSFGPMMEKMAATIFGHQVGQIMAEMAHNALSSTDGGVALTQTPVTALVVRNVEQFAEEVGVDTTEVFAFLSLRECAHARLFNGAPWLREELVSAVARYGKEISIDTDAMREVVTEVDLSDPQSLPQASLSAVFSFEATPGQELALERLETLLALVEGWVEVVTTNAARPFLPHVDALVETMRRRRLDGGPTEQMLARLINLNTRPQQVRAASRLWSQIAEREGVAFRDNLWTHPDMVPGPEDLEDPDGYFQRRQEAADADADIDAALEQMISGTLGWAEGLDPQKDSEGDAKGLNAGSASGATGDSAAGAGNDDGSESDTGPTPSDGDNNEDENH
ncbi:MAG: zinc-dependent metalloprotease [Actinomycetaceae bacterium]|nr:zinc-dependent metalloprotease [Actinomycetaceae bacterium]